jgi:hypothetical protein
MVENLIKSFEFAGLDEITSNNKSRRFKAFGTVELVDRHNEILPIEEFTKSMDDWMYNGGTLLDNHKGAPIGKALRWKKTTKSGLPAIEIVGEIYKTRLGDKVWEEMKQGKKEGLSVGGSIIKRETNDKGESILRGLEIDEFSIVGRAGNQGATLEAMSMAKSEHSEEVELSKSEDTVISEDKETEDSEVKEEVEEEVKETDNSSDITELKTEIKNLTADYNNLKKMVEEVIQTVTGTPAETIESVDKAEVKEEKVEKSENTLILESLQAISKTLESLVVKKADYKKEEKEMPKKPVMDEEEEEEEVAKKSASVEEVIKVETPSPNHASEMEVKKGYSELYKEFEAGTIDRDQFESQLRGQ